MRLVTNLFILHRKPLNIVKKLIALKDYLSEYKIDLILLCPYFYLRNNSSKINTFRLLNTKHSLPGYWFKWLNYKHKYVTTTLTDLSFFSYVKPNNITPTNIEDIQRYIPNFLPKNYFNTLYHHKIIVLDTIKIWWEYLSDIAKSGYGFSIQYIRSFVFILFIDACLTDDEPLWEPIEWSLVQTWILFIFTFAWIAENLIVSRYGSYSGRDKRVWMGWYKTFWLIEGYYVINYGIASIFVILPFYYETNYNLSFVYSWWHWYSRTFFYKFTAIFTLVMIVAHYIQLNIRYLRWNKLLLLVALINIFIAYLVYTQFIITFLGFLTDPIWYQKTYPIDYIQLSHEPARWGWGIAKKDHFTYHNVKTVFWFKNDGPFASSFVLAQMFLFVCLFLLLIYWVTLFRRIYSTNEIPLTYTTYCVSSLKQFMYFFGFMYVLVIFSFLSSYARFPVEFLWSLDNVSWLSNFINIIKDYPMFLISIIW